MGLITNWISGASAVSALGNAVRGVAEVFTPNASRAQELGAAAQQAALSQLGAEYASAGTGWFDRMVNGLNRLPRPMLAFGTLGLFVYAMVEPEAFARRMIGLNYVPEPLWWLLGAVVGFYFGAREAFHFRSSPPRLGAGEPAPAPLPPSNAALMEWRGTGGGLGD